MIQDHRTDTLLRNNSHGKAKMPTTSAFLKRTSYHHSNRKQTTFQFHNGGSLGDDFSDLFSDEPANEPIERWAQNKKSDENGDLSFEQMWEFQKILDTRVKCKLSDGLSPEGRKAMEMAKAEVEVSDRKKKTCLLEKDLKLTDLDLPSPRKRGKVKKISFADAYESSSASRYSGDILDENSSDGNPRKWALGGGNIGVAMETVEIVSYGDASSSEADDLAIEETAKLNSVEKCLVWMGVHTENDFEQR